MDRCDFASFMDKFFTKYSSLRPAIDVWQFEAWVYEESTPQEDAMAKRADQIVTQFAMWHNLMERLVRHLAWAPDLEVRAQNMLQKLSGAKSQVDELGVLLSSLILVSVIARSEKENGGAADLKVQNYVATSKYVGSVLKVGFDTLPKCLRAKMDGSAAAAPLMRVRGGAAEGAGPSSSGMRPKGLKAIKRSTT